MKDADKIQAIIGEQSPSTLVGMVVTDCSRKQLIEVQGLSKGCMSTEADVWLFNGTLYVREIRQIGRKKKGLSVDLN